MLLVKQHATVTAITVRLQVLCSDKSPRQQRVLRAWGCIGTRIGGSGVGHLVSLDVAKEHFYDLFLKKTANS
uniref:WGR domain containing protein n=1 Tax=Echinococcus granulosus TaxID=6210 RepID=A0A068X541_ECHGR|nr:WGR domain containing protein [Echinococcus granulosus]